MGESDRWGVISKVSGFRLHPWVVDPGEPGYDDKEIMRFVLNRVRMFDSLVLVTSDGDFQLLIGFVTSVWELQTTWAFYGPDTSSLRGEWYPAATHQFDLAELLGPVSGAKRAA